MVVFYILATMWSAGCIIAPLWGAWSVWRNDGHLLVALVITTLVLPLGVAGAVAPWAFIVQEQSPDLATLKKNEWVCTASHQQTVLIGRVVSQQTVCDQYSRI